MALNFPSNPTEGQLFTDPNGVVWEFNGYGWKEKLVPTLVSMTDVSDNTPNIGDKLIWDGTEWLPQEKLTNLGDLSDIDATGVSNGDYLLYDGTNWIKNIVTEPTVYAELSCTSGAEVNPNDEQAGTFVFEDVILDTNSMTDVDKIRITIQEDGFYNIVSFINMEDGQPPQTNEYYFQIFIYVYDSNDVLKYTYVDNHGTYFDDFYVYIPSGYYHYRSNVSFYENFDVGDYLYMYWRSHYGHTDPLYKTNVSMSALKINEKI